MSWWAMILWAWIVWWMSGLVAFIYWDSRGMRDFSWALSMSLFGPFCFLVGWAMEEDLKAVRAAQAAANVKEVKILS